MGNNNSRPPLGDLDIYICGNVARYSKIISSIFTIKTRSLNNTINLKDINEKYYKEGQYEYEYLKLFNKAKNIKGENIENIYNAFLFSNNVNQEFADILFFNLKEYDVHNKRKNVIISFGYENFILNSMVKLNDISQESIPILIIIDKNFIYDERLDYVNYIPSLSTIKRNLRKENQNYDRMTLNDLSKKCLITYIKTKLFRICAYYNEMGYKLNMINPINDINAKISLHATIALVGDSGTGKSTLLNIVFNELVSKANVSSEDVTLKCSEYYLPVQTENENDEKVGQLRFLDFPGLNENNNYILVEKEINSKLKEYKENLEQIDIALFFIRNGQGRTINENHKKLIDLLSKNNIKILFIINGKVDNEDLLTVQQSLKNSINTLEKDFNNLIFTNYKKRPDLIRRDGISVIFQKLLEIIQVNIRNFNINTINNENYRTILNNLYRTNRIFQIYEDFETMQENTKKNAIKSACLFSFLSLASSSISIFVPLVDSGLTIVYQVAMTYNILYIYNANPHNYNITSIILSGGRNTNKLLSSIQVIADNGIKIANEAIKREIIEQSSKEVIKEVSKEVVAETSKQLVKETSKEVAKEVLEETTRQAFQQGIKELSKEAIEETSKECVKLGLKETTKQVITKGAILAGKEGA